MPNALLIAEKPDLMRKIQAVYEEHNSELDYTIHFTTQRGHLLTLLLPSEMDEEQKDWKWENLPFHPEEHGGWQYKVIPETGDSKYLTSKERFEIIKKELGSGKYDFVIHAGDPEQEGELLVRVVLDKAGNELPVKRFWTNALTEKNILHALKNLKDDDNDPMLTNLLAAAYARQHSDYRYGMNISEAATLRMNGRVACGRVKTPILAIVVKKERELREYREKTTFGVRADYQNGFSGDLSERSAEEDESAGLLYFDDRDEAESIMASLSRQGRVVEYEEREQINPAPKLFKLATLQIEAGKLGINDATTLKITQSLYEKGYVTYPRTDCEYLSSGEDFFGMLKSVLRTQPDLAPFIKTITPERMNELRTDSRFVNDKKLENAGHSAICPTTKRAVNMTEDEQRIYSLISKRFVAIFMEPQVLKKTRVYVDIDGRLFKSTGSVLIKNGWGDVLDKHPDNNEIPVLQKGSPVGVDEFSITEKTTTKPRRYTSPDLIAVCENPLKFLNDKNLKKLGKRLTIGTPATRSAIIRQLIEVDRYLKEEKEGKKVYLRPTARGEFIIDNLDECQITRVDMTGQWEERLEMVRSGKLTLPEIESEMRSGVEEMIEEIKNKPMTAFTKPKRVEICDCPKCDGKIIEGDKSFYCSNYKNGCKVGFFKRGGKFEPDEFMRLYNGEVLEKQLISKTGNPYTKRLRYDKEKDELIFEEEAARTFKYACPLCSGEMEETSRMIKCKSCGFTVWRIQSGVVLSDEDLADIMQDGITRRAIPGMKKKDGTAFKKAPKIGIDHENKRTTYVF